jgi:hypothetical protein
MITRALGLAEIPCQGVNHYTNHALANQLRREIDNRDGHSVIREDENIVTWVLQRNDKRIYQSFEDFSGTWASVPNSQTNPILLLHLGKESEESPYGVCERRSSTPLSIVVQKVSLEEYSLHIRMKLP